MVGNRGELVTNSMNNYMRKNMGSTKEQYNLMSKLRTIRLGLIIIWTTIGLMMGRGVESQVSNSSSTITAGAPPKQPSSFQFYLHNTILDPVRYNNTNYFNSAFTVTPVGFTNAYNFGVMATFEDPATEDASNTSTQVGVARGFFLYDSQTEFILLQAFTLNVNTSTLQGSLQLFGQLQESLMVRVLSVIGGSGDFFLARGIASCTLVELDTTSGPTKWTLYFYLDLYY